MTLATTDEVTEVRLPAWSEPFFGPHRYKCVYGGRASSKTWSIAHILVIEAAQKKLHIMCCREFQATIASSAKAAVETAIRRLGLSHFYKVQTHKILGKNGSVFEFKGIEQSREEIRGWEGIDRTWVEEAQRMSADTADVLLPTIFRTPGAQLIVTWNPISRTDWVYHRFVSNPRPGDLTKHVNYYDNSFLPAAVWEEAEACKRDDPQLYAHVWLGEPDDGAASTRILAFSVLMDCVEAWRQGLAPKSTDVPVVDAGLDIADGGVDRNAMVIRQGPTIAYAASWPSSTPGVLLPTAARATELAHHHDVYRLYYDATGVGGPIRGDFGRLSAQFSHRPLNFGDPVAGPGRRYERGRSNKDVFARRNAQLGFGLRLRAMRTLRLLRGADVDPNTCLFIPDDGRVENLHEFLAALSRPKWRANPVTGRIEIDKTGGEDKSPDLYDATALAFARDSEGGLRAV